MNRLRGKSIRHTALNPVFKLFQNHTPKQASAVCIYHLLVGISEIKCETGEMKRTTQQGRKKCAVIMVFPVNTHRERKRARESEYPCN